MSARPTDPLSGVRLVVVDGTNLLHALAADRGMPGTPPATALVGRLRAVIPAPVAVEIVLDGSSDRGLATRRLTAGITVRYAASRSADDVVTNIVDVAARTTGNRPAILVVTDDRGLAADVRRRGATTTGSTWLLGRLSRARLASPSVGVARPSAPRSVAPASDDDARPAWRPGRGATRKHGNPKRRRRGGPATMRP